MSEILAVLLAITPVQAERVQTLPKPAPENRAWVKVRVGMAEQEQATGPPELGYGDVSGFFEIHF